MGVAEDQAAIEADQGSVQTPREALHAIRYEVSAIDDLRESPIGARLTRLVRLGLESRTADFELTDHLANQLANCHQVLRMIEQDYERMDRIEGGYDRHLRPNVKAVLALPPDLESMIERRIGPG